jgi:hypothetical protein
MEHQTGPDGHRESDATSAADLMAWVHTADPTAAPEGGLTAVAPEAGRAVSADPVPPTGEPRVDAALRLLDRLPGLPVSEHPDLFEQVHAQLSDVLGELDSGPAGA